MASIATASGQCHPFPGNWHLSLHPLASRTGLGQATKTEKPSIDDPSGRGPLCMYMCSNQPTMAGTYEHWHARPRAIANCNQTSNRCATLRTLQTTMVFQTMRPATTPPQAAPQFNATVPQPHELVVTVDQGRSPDTRLAMAGCQQLPRSCSAPVTTVQVAEPLLTHSFYGHPTELILFRSAHNPDPPALTMR
jgi:hypothetical protein